MALGWWGEKVALWFSQRCPHITSCRVSFRCGKYFSMVHTVMFTVMRFATSSCWTGMSKQRFIVEVGSKRNASYRLISICSHAAMPTFDANLRGHHALANPGVQVDEQCVWDWPMTETTTRLSGQLCVQGELLVLHFTDLSTSLRPRVTKL